MQRGDLLRMVTPSGGGFGDPFARDPALVASEVVDGLLSVEQARAQYGVVIAGGAIDATGTAAARGVARPPPAAFDLGPVRAKLETKWPPSVSAALAASMLGVPAGLRSHVLAARRAELAGADGPVSGADVTQSATAVAVAADGTA